MTSTAAPSRRQVLRRFHAELTELVRRAEAGPWPATRPLDLEPLAERLVAALAAAEDRLAQGGSPDPAVDGQVAFLLAAHADDLLARADWPGAEHWQGDGLEARRFASHAAPLEIFARIKRLLGVPTPENRELAGLYLLAIGLGFRGGLPAEPEADAMLAGVRRELLRLALPARAHRPEGARRVFSQAYGHTLNRGEPRPRRAQAPWLVLAAALAVLFGLASAPLWNEAVKNVRELVGAAAAGTPRPPASGGGA